jgi:hypothetical protein
VSLDIIADKCWKATKRFKDEFDMHLSRYNRHREHRERQEEITQTELPPEFMLGLLMFSDTNVRHYSDLEIWKLMKVAETAPAIAVAAAAAPDRLEERLNQAKAFDDFERSLMPRLIEELDDPIAYIAALTASQKRVIQRITNGWSEKSDISKLHFGILLKKCEPKHLDTYMKLYTKEKGKLRNFVHTEEDPNKTIALYKKLSAKERVSLFKKYTPIEAGRSLRVFGVEGNVDYGNFIKYWRAISNYLNPLEQTSEEFVKPFIEGYVQLNEDKQRELIPVMESIMVSHRPLDESAYSPTMKHAAQHMPTDPEYLFKVHDWLEAGEEFNSAFNLASDESLQARWGDIAQRYKPTWMTFYSYADAEDKELVVDMTQDTIAVANEAYKISVIDKSEEKFLCGFNQVLKQGAVKFWAKAIIDNHNLDLIGGSNYRSDREVIAA